MPIGYSPSADDIAGSLGDGSLRNPNEIEGPWRQGQQEKKVAFDPSTRNASFDDWRKGLNEKGLLPELNLTHIAQHPNPTLTSEDTASGYAFLLGGTGTPIGFGTDSPLTFGFEGFVLQGLGTDIPPIMPGGFATFRPTPRSCVRRGLHDANAASPPERYLESPDLQDPGDRLRSRAGSARSCSRKRSCPPPRWPVRCSSIPPPLSVLPSR